MLADEDPGAQNDRLSLQRTTKFCHSEPRRGVGISCHSDAFEGNYRRLPRLASKPRNDGGLWQLIATIELLR